MVNWRMSENQKQNTTFTQEQKNVLFWSMENFKEHSRDSSTGNNQEKFSGYQVAIESFEDSQQQYRSVNGRKAFSSLYNGLTVQIYQWKKSFQ